LRASQFGKRFHTCSRVKSTEIVEPTAVGYRNLSGLGVTTDPLYPEMFFGHCLDRGLATSSRYPTARPGEIKPAHCRSVIAVRAPMNSFTTGEDSEK